jgi:hypothetical protein
VHLDKDAHRTVYLQTETDGSSLQGTRPATDQLSCAAHGVSSGKNLDLSRTTEDLTLTRNDDTYKGRFQTAHAPAADDYRFTCRYEPNPERRFPMAVGPYLSVGTIVKAIGIALGSLLLGFLLAGAIVALVALRRQRSRRLLVNEAMARHRTGVGQPGSPG